MADNNDEEIGRELAVTELKAQQVVVVAPPGKDFFITVWVKEINQDTVLFAANEINQHIINFIVDGQIFDDQGRVVHVYEYLGDI